MADTLPLIGTNANSTPAPLADAASAAPLLAVGRDQLARMLGVGTATLDRLRAAGKVPAPARLGGRLLWPIEEVRAWLRYRVPGGELATANQWAAVRATVLARN